MDSSLMCNQRLFHFAFDTALRNDELKSLINGTILDSERHCSIKIAAELSARECSPITVGSDERSSGSALWGRTLNEKF